MRSYKDVQFMLNGVQRGIASKAELSKQADGKVHLLAKVAWAYNPVAAEWVGMKFDITSKNGPDERRELLSADDAFDGRANFGPAE